MTDEMNTGRKPDIPLVVLVFVGGAVAGGGFGWFAGQAYGIQIEAHAVSVNQVVLSTGMWWGAVTGIVAAAFWCRVMIPEAIRSNGEGLGRAGAIAGLKVGILSTILLHVPLVIVSDHAHPIICLIGLACGVAAGSLVGAACAAAWSAAVKRAVQAGTEPGGDGEE